MPRRTPSAIPADHVLLPVDAYLGLQAFHNELIGIAQTIDPADAPSPAIRKPEQSRRRALARVFRLWADQVHGNLQAIRSK
ncbi:XAC0095 family protein [Pseudomonas sp. CGJS7]|uniref:XAC0095 family protein n=1 Tax=Pseudomonas sp. CGJS7 TaxID=3109348 RepID=UPI00300A1583